MHAGGAAAGAFASLARALWQHSSCLPTARTARAPAGPPPAPAPPPAAAARPAAERRRQSAAPPRRPPAPAGGTKERRDRGMRGWAAMRSRAWERVQHAGMRSAHSSRQAGCRCAQALPPRPPHAHLQRRQLPLLRRQLLADVVELGLRLRAQRRLLLRPLCEAGQPGTFRIQGHGGFRKALVGARALRCLLPRALLQHGAKREGTGDGSEQRAAPQALTDAASSERHHRRSQMQHHAARQAASCRAGLGRRRLTSEAAARLRSASRSLSRSAMRASVSARS